MTLMETPVCNFGEKAHDFNLLNIDGQHLTLEDCRGEKGTLVMFLSNHCPYVKAIQSQLVNDINVLLESGIKAVAIMPNDTVKYSEDSFENMQKHARNHGYPFPYLFDESQETARQYGAICTPDFFGYNKQLELQYRGRLDATTPSNPAKPDARRDLLLAMQEIAKTGNGPRIQIPSMGCSIKWKEA